MNITQAEQRIRVLAQRNAVTKKAEFRVVFLDEVQVVRVRSGAIQNYEQARMLRCEWIAMWPVKGIAL